MEALIAKAMALDNSSWTIIIIIALVSGALLKEAFDSTGMLILGLPLLVGSALLVHLAMLEASFEPTGDKRLDLIVASTLGMFMVIGMLVAVAKLVAALETRKG
jgi:hypothetical protein